MVRMRDEDVSGPVEIFFIVSVEIGNVGAVVYNDGVET